MGSVLSCFGMYFLESRSGYPNHGVQINTGYGSVTLFLLPRSKLTEMSVEELKSVLNDEDHFDKFLIELETDYQPLGTTFIRQTRNFPFSEFGFG